MSKICFLTDRLPTDNDPFSALIWNQFRILAESQHDVLVISSGPAPKDLVWQHPRLQIVEPFPNWSLRYLPRFIKLLAYHKPDVLHWIEPRTTKLGLLQWIAPALATLKKRPLLAISLWDPARWEKGVFNSGTLPAMDILFVTHPLHRERIWSRWPQLMSRVQVAPLLFHQQSPSHHWITKWADDFAFVPGQLSDALSLEDLLEGLRATLSKHPQRKAVIPMSGRRERFLFLEALRSLELDGRVAVLESLDWATWQELYLRASEIRADLLKSNSPYLSLALQWGRIQGKHLKLTPKQGLLLHEIQFQDASNFLARAYQAAFKQKAGRLT
jgi:hypothetical protein